MTATNTIMSHPITIRQVNIKVPFEHIAHHKFPLPSPGDPGFYRTVNTFNAFFNGSRRRNRTPAGHLFSEVDMCGGDTRSDWEQRRDAKLLVHEHASLQDFFVAIGFDSKTKKYNT